MSCSAKKGAGFGLGADGSPSVWRVADFFNMMENMMEQFYTADVRPFKMENDDPGDHTHVLFLIIT